MTSGRPAEVLAHVAANVRRWRVQAGMSQQQLADAAGMSRRTIINLEAGQANVSLSALDTLAAALNTTFVELVIAPSATPDRIDELMWAGAHPASRASLLGSAPAHTEGQLWSWSLAPGDHYEASPDPVGWHEMIFVTAGELVLVLDDDGAEHRLTAGDHRTYSSAQHYAYRNDAAQTATFVRIVLA